jgi:hypothetical protein
MMDRDELLRDDAALDRALGSLGVPPAARPRAGAMAILAGLAAGATPAAAAAGLAMWKVVAIAFVGTTLGVSGGYVLNDVVRETGRAAYTGDQIIEACESLLDSEVPAETTAQVIVEAPVPDEDRGSQLAATVAQALPPQTGHRGGPGTRLPPTATAPLTADVGVQSSAESPPAVEETLDDDDWIPEPEPYLVERTDPAPGARSSDVDRSLETRVEVGVPPRHPGERRRAETRFRAAAGVSTTVDQWGDVVAPVGVDVRLGILQLGPSRAVVRPLAAGDLDLVLMPADDGSPTRFVGAIQGGAGIALEGRRLRLDLSWAVAGRLMPAAAGADDLFDSRAGWLWVSSGPQVGLAVTPRSGPVFTASVSAQGSVLDLDGSGKKALQPWIGLVAGVELPVRRRR